MMRLVVAYVRGRQFVRMIWPLLNLIVFARLVDRFRSAADRGEANASKRAAARDDAVMEIARLTSNGLGAQSCV